MRSTTFGTEFYPSVAAAARAVGCNKNTLYSAIRAGRFCHGHWKFMDRKRDYCRPVLCVETGEYFESARAAANQYRVSVGTVLRSARSETWTKIGDIYRRFEFVEADK